MNDVVAQLRAQSGLPVVGAFAFGDSPRMQDELLAFVRAGTKRATVSSVAELADDDGPAPEPGLHWGLLDGRGVACFVAQTVQVTRGRLGAVTPAFAWDEGEFDRTRERWLEGHRSFYRRVGVTEPDDLEVIFERFRIVWPDADATVWLVDDVRELRWDERDWLRTHYVDRWTTTARAGRGPTHEAAELPGLVCERAGDRVGVLMFRPHPGGTAECVAIDALPDDASVVTALTEGAAQLGRRNGWQRIRLTISEGDEESSDAYRRAGWEPVRERPRHITVADRVGTLAAERDGDSASLQVELEIRL